MAQSKKEKATAARKRQEQRQKAQKAKRETAKNPPTKRGK
jgi:hypothetical protein